MKRFLAGVGFVSYIALSAPQIMAQFAYALLQLATMINSIDLMIAATFLLYMQSRIVFFTQTIYTGIKTSFTRLHLFYAGIVLAFLSTTVLVFIPGGAIITAVWQNIFNGTTVIGSQLVQAFIFTLGVVFILIDFPHRKHVSPSF